MINRKITKSVLVGGIQIGGGAPIVVQSMTKSKTNDIKKVLKEIKRLETAGCEIVRLAIPNETSAQALKKIKKFAKIPIIADIHFDYRLALKSIEYGADKIRINPGNIGPKWKIIEIIKAAKERKIPIRIGVNAGSLKSENIKKQISELNRTTEMLESLKRTVDIFLSQDFEDIVLAGKTTDPEETIEVYRKIAQEFPYPIHLGLTEAGLPFEGVIRSTAALSILLKEGIGDTIRISLTGDSVLEVQAAYELLQSLGLRKRGPIIISCPTCGRCEVNLRKIAQNVKNRLKRYRLPVKVAVMGCVVNGPGEAREADYGIACGKRSGLIFKKGNFIKKCREEELVDALINEISKF